MPDVKKRVAELEAKTAETLDLQNQERANLEALEAQIAAIEAKLNSFSSVEDLEANYDVLLEEKALTEKKALIAKTKIRSFEGVISSSRASLELVAEELRQENRKQLLATIADKAERYNQKLFELLSLAEELDADLLESRFVCTPNDRIFSDVSAPALAHKLKQARYLDVDINRAGQYTNAIQAKALSEAPIG